jgi:hypothetical protein
MKLAFTPVSIVLALAAGGPAAAPTKRLGG